MRRRAKLPLSEPRTVADLLAARVGDDHVAIVFEGRPWSWADVMVEAQRRAAMLTAARVDGPFHVGVLLDNVPEYVFMLAAAGICGATIVGVNPTRRGEHLAGDIRHTDCQLLVTDHEHRSLLDGVDFGVAPDGIIEIDDPNYERRLPPATETAPALAAAPAPDDLYVLLFTSGSAGAPKAVRMTHARATRASDSPMCTRADIPYCAMPLFHGNALIACVLPAFRFGNTVALKRKFSASEFIDDVRANGCTYFSAIGRVLNYILATPPRSDDRDNKLKLVLGPESSPADMRAFQERFGCPVFAGYGSSENAIVLLPAPRTAEGAMGVSTEGDDVVVIHPETGDVCPTAIFDEGGALLNGNEAIGELVGRNTLDRFEGYYNNPEAEQERRRNGWYWSGDLAYRDADGVFWFAGRTADWIRVDGENFATAPVERVLARFDNASSVAAYGVPDERNAEDQVMAALELVDGAAFDASAFSDFLANEPDLGTKWVPRFVRIVDRMPVTGTDKIDKKPLRADAWNTDDNVWWRPNRRGNEYRRLDATERDALNQALAANRKGIAR